MTLRVRGVSTEDEAEWRRLWAQYLAFYHTTLPIAVTEAPPHSPSSSDRRWADPAKRRA